LNISRLEINLIQMKGSYKSIVIVLFFFLSSTLSNAQQRVIDSLKSVLAENAAPKAKARVNILLGKQYIWSDTVLAKKYLQNGFDLATQSNDDMAKGMYHLYNAYMLCNKGLYNDGLIAFEHSAELFRKASGNKIIQPAEQIEIEELLFDAEVSRGNVLLELFEYEEAINVFTGLLNELDKSNIPAKTVATAATLQSIALAYYHRAQYQASLDYYLKAGRYWEKGGTQEDVVRNNIYSAMCYNLLGKFDSAFKLLNQSEPYVETSSNSGLKVDFYARKAELYRFSGKCNEAVNYYNKAIASAKITGNVYLQSTFLYAKGKCLLKLGHLTEARTFVNEALILSISINKTREILEAQKILSEIEARSGNFKLAYDFLRKYTIENDSLRNQEITQKMVALEKKYEAERKGILINQLEKDNNAQAAILKITKSLSLVLTGLILVLLALSVLAYRNYKNKQLLQQHRINELETEKQLSATEAVLKGEEQERTRLSKDLHDGLGGMLSGIKFSMNTMKGNLILTPENAQAFERSMDMLDSSIKEMRRIAHNMMPEALVKFGLDTALSDFCNDINQSGALKVSYQSIGMVEARLDQTTSITIFRIVQELIHNTLKHAVAKHAIVQLSKTASLIAITVEDDGKGFDPEMLKKTNGIGWSNILHRVEFMKGVLNVQSVPGKGTSVHIELNI
jgi:two-component system, NarL family, sensor kinase